MYIHTQKPSLPEVARLRKVGGAWLKRLRERRGMSQTDLAIEVGVEHYRFISQIENGRVRLPPDRYEVWADALNLDLKVFVTEILRFYDPVTYDILFGEAGKSRGRPAPTPPDLLVADLLSQSVSAKPKARTKAKAKA